MVRGPSSLSSVRQLVCRNNALLTSAWVPKPQSKKRRPSQRRLDLSRVMNHSHSTWLRAPLYPVHPLQSLQSLDTLLRAWLLMNHFRLIWDRASICKCLIPILMPSAHSKLDKYAAPFTTIAPPITAYSATAVADCGTNLFDGTLMRGCRSGAHHEWHERHHARLGRCWMDSDLLVCLCNLHAGVCSDYSC